jgi:phosphoesterase RecJ-like protein
VLQNPELTPQFAPLLEGLTKSEPEEGDLLVAVDVAAVTMFPREYDSFRDSIDLRIDHHGKDRGFTPLSLIDSESASCAELIWDLFGEMDIEMDEKMADAIYVGTATDTGCFRFANTNAHTFDTAADCTAAGADIFYWNQLLFDTNTMSKLRLQGWVAEHTVLFAAGKLATCAIPKAVEESLGVDEDDLGNLSSFLRTIEGVCMAALLREVDENNTKVSVRALPGHNAAAVCEQFEGGGHAGAAGCSIRMPLKDAEEAIRKAMLAWEIS